MWQFGKAGCGLRSDYESESWVRGHRPRDIECRAHSRYTQREEAWPFEPHGRGRGYEDAALLTSTQQGDAGTCQGRPNGKPRATPAVTRDQVGDIPTWPKVCSLLGGPAPFHSHDLAEPRTTSHSYPKEQGPCSEWGI